MSCYNYTAHITSKSLLAALPLVKTTTTAASLISLYRRSVCTASS